MNSPECNKATKSLSAIDVFVVSSSSSSSTSTSSSLDSLIHCDNNDNILPKAHFKSHKSTGTRRGEVQAIRSKYPSKIPVIVERYDQETSLPRLQKSKFLVPKELSMSQLVTVVRNRLRLSSTQAIFLMVNNRSIASLSRTVSQVYGENREPDGFLYLTYASQEAFGSNGSNASHATVDNVDECFQLVIDIDY